MEQSEEKEIEGFWKKIKYLLNHDETKKTLDLIRKVIKFNNHWSNLIETGITLSVAIFLIFILKWFVDASYIDKSTFGVMFGTVFGYLLSWRFGK